uniref:ATP synthase complex subunit 8 n=1 Tax=Temnopleurus reevesii TaxID=161071 RepID=A0A1L6Z758_9ECHN|nr:ATP synthase F0 subunit 8 [Temnopleurus reevesii]APT42115.1 ATP synthase F0 subunit 8 [Temnopleurus reevesii]
MPQLDFVWWIINFLLVWVTLFAVLATLLNNKSNVNVSQQLSTNVNKSSTDWQWL